MNDARPPRLNRATNLPSYMAYSPGVNLDLSNRIAIVPLCQCINLLYAQSDLLSNRMRNFHDIKIVFRYAGAIRIPNKFPISGVKDILKFVIHHFGTTIISKPDDTERT